MAATRSARRIWRSPLRRRPRSAGRRPGGRRLRTPRRPLATSRRRPSRLRAAAGAAGALPLREVVGVVLGRGAAHAEHDDPHWLDSRALELLGEARKLVLAGVVE